MKTYNYIYYPEELTLKTPHSEYYFDCLSEEVFWDTIDHWPEEVETAIVKIWNNDIKDCYTRYVLNRMVVSYKDFKKYLLICKLSGLEE